MGPIEPKGPTVIKVDAVVKPQPKPQQKPKPGYGQGGWGAP